MGEGVTFGGLLTVPFKAGASEDYYGNSSSFVFTFKDNICDVYHGTAGSNNMYFFSHPRRGIGFGGGGTWAFWLDAELNHGTSGESDTYANSVLTSSSEFTIADVEVYGLQI